MLVNDTTSYPAVLYRVLVDPALNFGPRIDSSWVTKVGVLLSSSEADWVGVGLESSSLYKPRTTPFRSHKSCWEVWYWRVWLAPCPNYKTLQSYKHYDGWLIIGNDDDGVLLQIADPSWYCISLPPRSFILSQSFHNNISVTLLDVVEDCNSPPTSTSFPFTLPSITLFSKLSWRRICPIHTPVLSLILLRSFLHSPTLTSTSSFVTRSFQFMPTTLLHTHISKHSSLFRSARLS